MTHLRRGGLAIVTLKGGGKNPLDGARRGLDVLRQEYVVLHARQLHHNRNEITVIASTRIGARGDPRAPISRPYTEKAGGQPTTR